MKAGKEDRIKIDVNCTNMQTTKQIIREEKKRKKLAALANLIQMNDHDRLERLTADRGVDEELLVKPSQSQDDEGYVKVSKKKKKEKLDKPMPMVCEDEPHTKRHKIANGGDVSDNSAVSHSHDEEMLKMKLKLSKAEYKDLKRQLRERKRQLENATVFRLREFGARACIDVPQYNRTPIFLTDVQHLLMSALLGKKSPCSPSRWCHLEKLSKLSHTVVLIVEGFSLYHYLSNESQFEQANKIFETKLEVVLPSCEKGSIIKEFVQVPLTIVQARELIETHGSLESAIEMNKDPTLLVKNIFPIDKPDGGAELIEDLPEGDKFSRTKLLLSALQMVDEGYPIPLRGELRERFKNYVFTKEKYAPVTARSPMFGLDCEMCRTAKGTNELTRISIVNENQETVYETLVMPSNKIIDYLTPYSGITPEIMKTVTKKLSEVQEEVRALLPPDAILVGQSLNSDLNAMRMMHPYVIDTSVCFNLTGERRRKSKLQTLAMTFLKESIQEQVDGHDSVEDSLAGLNLVKMKLANSIEFGDEILLQKKSYYEIVQAASSDAIKNNLFAHISKRDKSTTIITNGTLDNEVKEILLKAQRASDQENSSRAVLNFELNSNKEVVKKTREVALEHSLTVANLHLNEEQLQLNNVDETLSQLDKWINKVWKTIAHSGMLVVLMGGAPESPTGLVKIAIKKNIGDVATEVPISVDE